MSLEGFHLDIEKIVASTLGGRGFALGGGFALQVHGIADRPSEDLDHYAASMDSDLFDSAETDLVRALADSGCTATTTKRMDWFRAIEVSRPSSNETLTIDLGYDHRQHPPVHIRGIGPVLDLEDVVTGKVSAFWERQAERDFYDVDRILASGRWTVGDLYEIVAYLRPDQVRSGSLSESSFATKLRSSHQCDTEEFVALGLTVAGLRKMERRLDRAATALEAGNANRRTLASKLRWRLNSLFSAPPVSPERNAVVPKELVQPGARNVNRQCGGRTKEGRRCLLRVGHGGYHRGR